MFPFASHGTHGYSLEYCAPLLARVGSLANKYGHRLTTHPGQYTQLGSPRPEVVEAAVRELTYHCEMLDRMCVGIDGVMIVHVNLTVSAYRFLGLTLLKGGGTYRDKATTLDRIKKTITQALPENVKNRLVLENDEVRIGV
jgi:UV DNA damage endonuclease